MSEKAKPFVDALERELSEGLVSAAQMSALYPTIAKKEDDAAPAKKAKAEAA